MLKKQDDRNKHARSHLPTRVIEWARSMSRTGPIAANRRRILLWCTMRHQASGVVGCLARPKGRRMRRGVFISLEAYVIAGCFAIITPGDFAHAQPKKPTATEDALGAKIKCQHFQKNSDGKWTSSPSTTIGKMDFSSHTFGVGEVDIGGADLATVLDRKCVAH